MGEIDSKGRRPISSVLASRLPPWWLELRPTGSSRRGIKYAQNCPTRGMREMGYSSMKFLLCLLGTLHSLALHPALCELRALAAKVTPSGDWCRSGQLKFGLLCTDTKVAKGSKVWDIQSTYLPLSRQDRWSHPYLQTINWGLVGHHGAMWKEVNGVEGSSPWVTNFRPI